MRTLPLPSLPKDAWAALLRMSQHMEESQSLPQNSQPTFNSIATYPHLFRKMGTIKSAFRPKMGTVKDKNGRDLVDAEEIKKR